METKKKPKPWKPKEYEEYFIPVLTNSQTLFYYGCYDKELAYENGLMCRTKEQAEELARLLIETARKYQGFESGE